MEHYYNTQQSHLLLKEYGRNIQKIAQYICTIQDREERTQSAYSLVELMRQINPNTRDSQDYQNKLWDDLFIMSNFKLDVDSPFPIPAENILVRKPLSVPYNTNNLKFKHYGKTLEMMILKAFKVEDEIERFWAIVQMARLMKAFYISWNKDNVEDSTILENIETIARTKLGDAFYERVKSENLLEMKDKGRNQIVQGNKIIVVKPEKNQQPNLKTNQKNTPNNNNNKGSNQRGNKPHQNPQANKFKKNNGNQKNNNLRKK
jgi:hypothetical protein